MTGDEKIIRIIRYDDKNKTATVVLHDNNKHDEILVENIKNVYMINLISYVSKKYICTIKHTTEILRVKDYKYDNFVLLVYV